METRDFSKKDTIRTVLIVLGSILINIAGKQVKDMLSLPLWLDSIGTVFAAYTLGPVCGAIVGCAGNIIVSFWDHSVIYYALTSIFIGLGTGYAARRKAFETLFHAMSAAGIITIISTVISTILNMILLDGGTNNLWGDGVIDFLISKGVPKLISSTVGQLYIEFADKVLTIISLFILIKLWRSLRTKLNRKKHTGSANITAALLAVTLAGLSAVSFSPLQVSAESNAETDDTEMSSNSSFIRTVYNGDNGLACGHANDVIQTNDGVLWVGSYSGLYRYNGSAFRFMSEFDTVKNVNCLFVDTAGRLWIGTNDSGVVVSINEEIAYSMNEKGGLPSDSVRCITQSADGDYYIGTSDKMVVVRLEMGITITHTLDELLYVKHVSSNSYGDVAAVTASGDLYILSDGRIKYKINPGNDDTFFTCCTFADNDYLYAGTADGRVIVYKTKLHHAKKEQDIVCGELSGINSIYRQDKSTFWILSDNGVGIIDAQNVFTHFETEGFNYSLENMTVDYQGNLWLASSRMGLMQLSPSAFTDVFGEYGLDPCVVNTTALTDDKLYIGTDGGLTLIDTEKKTTVENDLTKMLKDSRIRCLTKDNAGNLWICSYGKGLLELTSSGKIVSYDNEKTEMGSRVRVCLQLKDGRMAVGGDKGLYFIKNGEVVRSLLYGDKLGAAKILSLLELNDGRLLAGTDGNGIAEIKDGKVTRNFTRDDGLTSGVILRMVKDTVGDNNVFIATGNGLCYLKENEDGTTNIEEIKGFPYSNNFDIIIDKDDGDMFVPGSAGIYVVNRHNLLGGKGIDYILLNSKAGLMGALTSNAWNAISDDKTVYLSTDRGVYTLNMDAYKTKRRFYRILVTGILLDGVPASMKRGSGLSIDKDVTTVELVPEIINYTLENPSISYCLEGLDSRWNTVPQSDLSHIVYTNLPPGEYEFRLAILDQESGDILEETAYSFSKERAIYDNNWFMVYMVLLAVIFVGWLTWFLTRTQIQHTINLQQERLKLALQQVQMGNETILAIAKTVDAKDVRTSQHSQRVSDYSVMIARKYGFDDKELENLRKSALLHDIGKIGIPDAILNKPARLTDEEYAIMKTHVTRGAEILKDFTLVEHAVDGARYHHERYDGRGYPDRLAGKDIPLYGRIIAVADAFDAMTANRVYRKKQDFDYVLSELHKGRGTQFDPELLDIFLELIESGEIDIDKLYSDNSSNDEKKEENGNDGTK